MDRRFDFRDEATFRRDIKFGTQLEKYFFDKWMHVVVEQGIMRITSYSNNGCDNSGEFISSGTNTAGADYRVSGYTKTVELTNEPLEVKWVPTAGKFTLKKNDLSAYVRENANILFIYNTVNDGANLKKPKDYNLDRHIKLLESKAKDFKWGILWNQNVKRMYTEAIKNNWFKPISYMGNKAGLIIKQQDYSKWFNEYNWEIQ